MKEFLLDVAAGISSGAVLAGAAWWLARVPNISGTWTVQVTTQSSTWNPYKGLTVTYIAMLSQHGSELTGIAEKVFEKRADGSEYEFVGAGRKRSEISGGLRGNVFQKKRCCSRSCLPSISPTASGARDEPASRPPGTSSSATASS